MGKTLYASTKGGGKALQRNCRAIRQSDEVYCPDCSLRWSLNEDRPECPRK
jgi:hypothetical protein